MTAMYTVASGNLVPYLIATGVPATPVTPVWQDGYTLVAGTYYIPLASSEGPTVSECFVASVAVKWSLALTAAITLESSNFPSHRESTGQGAADVSDIDTGVGNWFQESLVAGNVLSAGGAGNSYAAPTFTAGGTAAGGAMFYIPSAAVRRYRLKVVVTVGGTLRAGSCGKD